MNSTDVKEICKQIIAEANAVIGYTDSIDNSKSKALKATFAEDMKDEVSHLQKLVVALTEVIDGKEPTIAEKMD